MRKFVKLFQTKATSIDEANKTVTFTISDNQVDRMGEVVDQKSWNFKDYMNNPIVLWGHNPDEPENVLGTAQSLDVSKDGSQTLASVKFDTDINPKADLVFNQVKRGSLRCVSVGFMNHSVEMDQDTPVLKDNDLLEISVVPIPANPRAVALDFKAGILSRKDAEWLMEGMRKEADFLQEQLEQDNEAKDQDMDEIVSKQLSALLEAVSALTEAQTKTNNRLNELADQIEEKGTIRKGLPIAPEDTEWSADEAIKRVKEWAADENGIRGIDWRKFAQAFLWFDSSAPDPDHDGLPSRQMDYKLPFADVIDGELKAVWHGVEAAYAAMKGARGGVDIPERDRAAVMSQLKKYYKKFDKEWPEDGKAFDLDSDGVSTKDASTAASDHDAATDANSSTSTADTAAADATDTATADTTTDASTTDEKTSDADDAAKGGDNDQPGAANGDEIDLDAELTPELQAQIDDSLATETAAA